jgi:ABC-type transport system involved in multi-copper enzyme maturation permease subunit
MIKIALFVSISTFLSIFIKNQTFSLITGVIILYLFDNLEGYARVIAGMFPEKDIVVQDLIVGLTPTGSLMTMRNVIFDNSFDAISSFQMIVPDIIKFLIYVVIACGASYIIFTRRDIA